MFESVGRIWAERKVLVIIGVSIVVLGLGSFLYLTFSNQAEPVLISSPEVSLTWWKADSSDKFYDNTIANFQALPGNENVEINILNKDLNDLYYNDLITDNARGIGPDIFTLQNNDLPAYREFLSPINTFSGATLANYRNDFVNQVVRQTMDKDKVFCTTNYVDTLQLFYNGDLLRQSQISRPASTWEELDNQIPFLRKVPLSGDEFITSPIAIGIGGRSIEGKQSNIENVGDIVAAMIYQYDGQIYDFQNERVALGKGPFNPNLPSSGLDNSSSLDVDSPSYEAIRFYNSFADVNSSRYSWNKSNPDAIEMFAQGRLVYNIGYKSFFDELKSVNPRLDIQVAPLPQRDNVTKRTIGRFNMDCLNSRLLGNASNPNDFAAQDKYQKAQEFMTFLATKDVQIDLANQTGLPSAHRDGITLQLDSDFISNTFANGALNADGYYQPNVQAVESMWLDLFEKVQYNNFSLEEATEDAINVYTQLVNAGPKLRT